METRYIIVWGMHRSGTSLLARATRVFGASLGEDLFAANPGNPTGYFEDMGLMRLDSAMLAELGMAWDSLSPVGQPHVNQLVKAGYLEQSVRFLEEVGKRGPAVALKDPRMTRLAPFWRRAFHEAGVVPACVVVCRRPVAVVNSLRKRSAPGGRPGLLGDAAYAAYLWLGYTLAALKYTTGYPRVLVQYENFLEQPREMLLRMGEKLDLQVNGHELDIFCESFIDARLNHDPGEKSACKLPIKVEDLARTLRDLPELAFPAPARIGRMWPVDEDGINLCRFIDETLQGWRASWRNQLARQK